MNPPAGSAASGRSVREIYELESARLDHVEDAAQRIAIERLDDLRTRLITRGAPKGLIANLLSRSRDAEPERGLYLWGGVGRGKTWLMDLFFASLPFRAKERSHFHRFMHATHAALARLRNREDPLEHLADRIAGRTRVLCFDEFFVIDIADAMVLGNLLAALFARGVTLVATSNVPPDHLYRDGLQRTRFLPAIALLKRHTHVLNVDGGLDYRLRLLERGRTWFDAADEDTAARLLKLFDSVAGETGAAGQSITMNHRSIPTLRHAADVVWFDFDALCDGPRSQADYIEIARCYHTVLLTDVPVLGPAREDAARRFVTLVDEFYDRGVKLLVSAPVPPQELYRGERLAFEFERTSSRLIEMQAHSYLARPHRP
jgi:cell division protein ZapE